MQVQSCHPLCDESAVSQAGNNPTPEQRSPDKLTYVNTIAVRQVMSSDRTGRPLLSTYAIHSGMSIWLLIDLRILKDKYVNSAEMARMPHIIRALLRARVERYGGDSAAIVAPADVVTLGFPPGELAAVFTITGLVMALRGKFIISLLAGVSYDKLAQSLPSDKKTDSDCHLLRVIPSIGAKINDSVTLMAKTTYAGEEQQKLAGR